MEVESHDVEEPERIVKKNRRLKQPHSSGNCLLGGWGRRWVYVAYFAAHDLPSEPCGHALGDGFVSCKKKKKKRKPEILPARVYVVTFVPCCCTEVAVLQTCPACSQPPLEVPSLGHTLGLVGLQTELSCFFLGCWCGF